MDRDDYILFSGGAPGAEAEFGANAERFGIEEVNFAFEGHVHVRTRGLRILNHEELRAGDVSLDYVSRLMNRRYTDTPTIRKVLQSIWYQVNPGQEIFVVGAILPDHTVKGGTGWGAEFAKLCNKPLYVFDQERDGGSRGRAGVGGLPRRRAGDPPRAFHRHRHAAPRRQRQGAPSRAVRTLLPQASRMLRRRSPIFNALSLTAAAALFLVTASSATRSSKHDRFVAGTAWTGAVIWWQVAVGAVLLVPAAWFWRARSLAEPAAPASPGARAPSRPSRRLTGSTRASGA